MSTPSQPLEDAGLSRGSACGKRTEECPLRSLSSSPTSAPQTFLPHLMCNTAFSKLLRSALAARCRLPQGSNAVHGYRSTSTSTSRVQSWAPLPGWSRAPESSPYVPSPEDSHLQLSAGLALPQLDCGKTRPLVLVWCREGRQGHIPRGVHIHCLERQQHLHGLPVLF